MKKITLFVALMCSLSAFSTRYLVEGTTGTNSWRIAGAGEVNVTLTTDFRTWYYSNTYTADGTDEIWLAGGTYTISLPFGSRKVNVYGGFAGTETSIADRSKVSGGKAWEFSNPTIIDGNNTSPQGFNSNGIATTPSTYIDGITITKCLVTNIVSNVQGVGAYITQGCVMQNCIVSNNTYNNLGAAGNLFDGNGGGIYLTGGQVLDSHIVGNQLIKGNGRNTIGGGIAFVYTSEAALNIVSGCTIENNTCTTYGGGIEITLGTGGTIENCIIKGNSCSDRGAGLGYTNIGSAGTSILSIKNCQFIENTSLSYGGGVALNFGTGATTIFENNSIIGNTGVTAGGMYIGGGKFSPIKNCIFRDNKSTDAANGANSSGALYCNVANIIIQNCVFANNSTVANTSTNCTVRLLNSTNKLYNCTFVNNSDPGAAGYTLNLNGQVQTVTNNVFWGNVATANFYTATNAISTYNATTSDKNTTGTTTGGGNVGNITTLTSSPNNTFASPTTFTGVPSTTDGGVQKTASAAADWSMIISSPTVDAGIDLTASGVATDISGNARPLGTAFDMGAYERSSVPTIINTVHNSMLCYSGNNSIEVRGLNKDEVVKVYGISGNLIYNQKALNSTISISLRQGIYLVHVNDRVTKVVVR
ncbi:MAG: right-handed parallel beta-helix repeat-containing protein [Sulfuricurvum sp.]|nr:right-handed parallel beta-helix repeat-containing protein [Sulfuricurvum sp.]